MFNKEFLLKSDYFRIEISYKDIISTASYALKSDYFRIEMRTLNGYMNFLERAKIRLF